MKQVFLAYRNILKYYRIHLTINHLFRAKKGIATLQYPEERWPRPERTIGFDHGSYNVIRSRLHVDIDDCIGCLKCERACPVDCIKIETEKSPSRGEDIKGINHADDAKNSKWYAPEPKIYFSKAQ